jgi:hypothetical protein
MKDKKRKYIYLNSLNFEGTVFQTQILDWLHLYIKFGIDFELIQVFNARCLLQPKYINDQVSGIKTKTNLFSGHIYYFPAKHIFLLLNTAIIYFKLFKYIFKNDEILVFSRALIGREMILLKKIFPKKIIFYFDSRAAAAEERKYTAIKKNIFTAKEYRLIAFIYFLEYTTLNAADKVFAVSDILKKYFNETYKMQADKLIKYPCLSDTRKFFYDEMIRQSVRSELGISSGTTVFLYAGGVSSQWHVAEQMFSFFDFINKKMSDVLFLFLTTDQISINSLVKNYEGLAAKIICRSVPNNQVYKYLNAADFGILFRENTVMNNVASPTKFAEYVLCGLPVIISEGVGDYTKFTKEHHVGIVIKKELMDDISKAKAEDVFNEKFDRTLIAEKGIMYLSKTSIIDSIANQFLI